MNERAKSIAQSITVIFAILSAFAQLGNSQFRQPVKVRLTDPGGRPLKNAELNISSPFGNFHGLTDSLGGYKLPGVAPGRYQIDVSFEGSVFERTITVEQRIDGRVVMNGHVIEPGVVYNGPEPVIELSLEKKAPPPTEAPPPTQAPPPEYTQPPATPPPASHALEKLSWNLWLEESHESLQFHPVTYLNLDQPYALVVDLAAFAYEKQTGTFASEVGGTLKKLIQATVSDQLNVQLYLLYDQRYFVPLAVRDTLQDFPISVAKIRAIKEDWADIPADISVASMKEPQYDRYRFGRATFPLRTNRKPGTTFLGLSVWYHGVPIEEITWPSVCIKTTDSDVCPEGVVQAKTLGGIDSAMLVALDRAKQLEPAVAIHLIDFGNRGTAVVFKCNDCTGEQKYFSWRVGKPLQGVGKELKNSILSGVDTSAQLDDPAWLEQAGLAISGLLFYGDDKEASDEARHKLTELMTKVVQGTTPSLFVRSISEGYDPLFLFPIGLASLEINGKPEHLGYHFRIESPLLSPDYKTGSCVRTWRVLLPKGNADDALARGRQALQPALTRLGQTLPECTPGSAAKSCMFKDIDAFASWVNSSSPEQPNTALLILSHHDHNRIYWDPAHTVPAALFNAQFQSPSIVVFNACGTAKPDETEVLSRLNRNGVSSMIATYSEVPGYMAGLFSRFLIDILYTHKNEAAYPLSQAVYDAAMKLRDESIPSRPDVPAGRKYGAFSLLFALVGNGGARLCVP